MSSAPDTSILTSLNIQHGTDLHEMKFAVTAWGKGRARVGVLQLANCPQPMETPALLLSTRKGLPVFISPDLLPSLPSPDSHLLQMSPLHLYVFTSLPLLLFGKINWGFGLCVFYALEVFVVLLLWGYGWLFCVFLCWTQF